MLKNITGHNARTLMGLVASSYLLMVTPGYLQVAVATHNDAKWLSCVFTLLFAAGSFIWMGVTGLQQLENTLTRHAPASYAPGNSKPSRFSIYFFLVATLGFVLFMLPLDIRGLLKAIKTDNTPLIACSIFLITLAIWASIKEVVTLKKRGVKGWIEERTRLRKV